MTEQKNGLSVLDTNQSAASWNVINPSKGKQYVIHTLLSMGFNQLQINKVLPELNIETQNDAQAIEQSIGLILNNQSELSQIQDVLSEEEEKEAIIRQKELHLFSKPISSEQIINNNPNLKLLLDINSDKSDRKLECIICMEEYSDDVIPRFLKCGHSFCEICLKEILKSEKITNGGKKINCPKCKEECRILNGDFKNIPINYDLKN